ncbi:MAG: DUF924 family protein [Pseudomonadota bacterium]
MSAHASHTYDYAPWRAVLDFWLDTIGPQGWYKTDPEVDRAIADRFSALVSEAIGGGLDAWIETPDGALALLILLDQFPRNLHRGSARAFEGDAHALEIAERAIARGHDRRIPEPERQFFYLPFEHAESLAQQNRAVALIRERCPSLPTTLEHAEKHRDLIRRFGRFPHRNAPLGREDTAEEIAFAESGGYRPGSLPTQRG